ncbi:hypothetical protein DPMN_099311 [Dreissena polymorpha]|uniref:Uncharacterized protein n=1 Tax=Dreissena polymorpha TaxID=45954 RepID=A0A9D4LDW7_DREPO|nr:hypothetical protein DPMN_099311 [Dreissena polymorpha]
MSSEDLKSNEASGGTEVTAAQLKLLKAFEELHIDTEFETAADLATCMHNFSYRPYTILSQQRGKAWFPKSVLRLPYPVINVDRLDIFKLIRGSNLSTKSMKDPTLYSVNDGVKTDPEKIDKVNEEIIRINDSAGQKEPIPDEYKENVSVKEKLDGEESDVTESEDELVQLVFGDAQTKTVVTDDIVVFHVSDNGHTECPNTVIQDNSTFENVEHVGVTSEDQDGVNVEESPVLTENVDEVLEPSTEERESVQVNDVNESANEVRERVEDQDGREILKPAPRRSDRV